MNASVDRPKLLKRARFFEMCEQRGMDMAQVHMLAVNRPKRMTYAGLWAALTSSYKADTYWPRREPEWQDGGYNFWLSPKGAIWHCNYGWHSRVAEVLSGNGESTDWLLNRGWIHVSGGRADHHCPLTITQKRVLERDWPSARLHPSYDYNYDRGKTEGGRQVVVRWDTPYDYRTPRAGAEQKEMADAA